MPSLSKVSQGNVEEHLRWIYEQVPVFRLLGKSVLINQKLVNIARGCDKNKAIACFKL